MQGFKSFAKKTEIYLDKGINTIIGPNGSGKSNVSDALCFVLGRLSIKSMRAAKAKNLLFMGSSIVKPAREAFVEIVFDNETKTFSLPSEEVSIKRIVKHSGVSIYKINGETKTRGEVVEMLAQAGIDPQGFNLILQGQIQAIVKMNAEERRKILEEVSGISIYESRKEKSLKELDKTDSRLKEILSVLREKTLYLKNLEKERAQALRFKDLEKTIRRCKYSLILKKISEKEKEITSVQNSISEKSKQKEKIKSQIETSQKDIDLISEKINKINNHIKKSTGVERDSLQEKISDLRAELEGLKVRKENHENRKSELELRIKQMNSSIPEYQKEIQELRIKSPLMAKKQEELSRKKEELSILEEQKNKNYSSKSELNSLKDRVKSEESRFNKLHGESDSLIKQIEEISQDLIYKNEEHGLSEITKLKEESILISQKIDKISELLLENTKLISAAESQISTAEEVRVRISEIDTCPLCQNKMTEEHLTHVHKDSHKKIKNSKEKITNSKKLTSEKIKEKLDLESKLSKIKERISSALSEVSTHRVCFEKQNYVKRIVNEIKLLESNISELKKKRDTLNKKSLDNSTIIEQYNAKLHEIEEISSRTEEDLDTTLLWKERELEKINQAISQNKKDLKEISQDFSDLEESISNKAESLQEKELAEQTLSEKFNDLYSQKDSLQNKFQNRNFEISGMQNDSRQIEEQINFLKVGDAKLTAERDSLKIDLSDLPNDLEPIKASVPVLQEKLEKAKRILENIGAINLRALEVFEGIKEEYDLVYQKVETLQNEKAQVLKIIDEIDKKKKRTFMKTYRGINELFSQNFAQLSSKGIATLDIQNPQDLFSAGIDISIKVGKGKYFDVTSLSGGEKTLIALSLLFAIQEFKPYHFYVFDEIDAALDKRNSERLSSLLKKYMTKGQYIVVTHNDAIITDSNFLYGVSMHDKVSKILSLKLN